MTETATLDLACELIGRPSVTPDDAGCQDLLIERLEPLGFLVERLPFGDTHNFWALRGVGAPRLVFAGHTDVVPAGPRDQWRTDPFEPTLKDGLLYGRGAADMKGSLAAMVTACERFVAAHPEHEGSIAFLVTSDEEGSGEDGTRRVVEWLQTHGESLDACLVGEPSSRERLGDVVKNGRRGSLHGQLLLQGRQGHVAYPHQVRNPIHVAGTIIERLAEEVWDEGNDFFPPTSFQITNIHGGTGAVNVVPGEMGLRFNFRYSTELDATRIEHRVRQIVETALANEEIRSTRVFGYRLDWQLSGEPFLTSPGPLVEVVTEAVRAECGAPPQLSTDGGTSDGRFIAPTGAQVVELGPVNATIHQVDEYVAVADLARLSRLYEGILIRYLGVED